MVLSCYCLIKYIILKKQATFCTYDSQVFLAFFVGLCRSYLVVIWKWIMGEVCTKEDQTSFCVRQNCALPDKGRVVGAEFLQLAKHNKPVKWIIHKVLWFLMWIESTILMMHCHPVCQMRHETNVGLCIVFCCCRSSETLSV